MMLDVGELLFPTDLSVTPTEIGRVLLVGSCVAEGMLEYLGRTQPGVAFDYHPFNNVMTLPARPQSEIDGYDFQFISLSLRDIVTDHAIMQFATRYGDIADQAFANLERALAASLLYATDNGLLSFVSTFSVPQGPTASSLDAAGSEQDFTALVQRLNARLAVLVRTYRNAYLADVDAVGAALGKAAFQDDMVSFTAHGAFWTARHIEHDTNPLYDAPPARIDPLPPLETIYRFEVEQYFRAIWRMLESLCRTVRQIDPVKLVIFDLDDTMWRGQLAEHYGDGGGWPQPHGWPVGLWDAVIQLRGRGILTAICSKNDAGLVAARWDRACSWLSLEDFTFREINWQPKAENIAAILRQASLTAKSVVFVDDNPVERAAVQASLPGIRAIGSNPYVTRRILLRSSETQVPILTTESMDRDRMMRAQQHREKDRASRSREEFLLDLGCAVSIGTVCTTQDARFARSLELLNKTNQFNTTGERHRFEDLVAFFAAGGRLYVFEVTDKFTAYGLVGVILFKDDCFVQFAMSCRVLGLDVETAVIGYVLRAESSEASTERRFTARVLPTQANMVSRDVFTRANFAEIEGEPSVFAWAGTPPTPPAHLTLSRPPEPEG